MRTPAILAIGLLAGCSGQNPYSFSGIVVYELFPFDGERTWEYVNNDDSVPYKLIGNTVGDPDKDGDTNIYTVEYWTECPNDDNCVDGTVLRRLQWSSTSGDGVFIHAYDAGTGLVDLDPPVQVALDTMKKDDVAETQSGGANWSSTMQGTEACPLAMTANWEDCGVFEITTDVGDGYPIAGKYWAAKGNNLAAMEISGEVGRWELSDVDCAGECDGIW